MKKSLCVLAFIVPFFTVLHCNFGEIISGGPDGPPCIVDIWIYNLDDGSQELALSENLENNLYAAAEFLPDGKHILFRYLDFLYKISIVTDKSTELSSSVCDSYFLSRDGAQVIHVAKHDTPLLNPDGSTANGIQPTRSALWLINTQTFEKKLVLNEKTGKVGDKWVTIQYYLPQLLTTQEFVCAMVKHTFKFNHDYTPNEQTKTSEYSLFRMTLDGSDHHTILKRAVSWFDISPQESEIMYESDGNIYMCDSAGQNTNFITRGNKPLFSPAGDKFVYHRDQKLFVSHKNGSEKKQLSPQREHITFFDFSPDGSNLIYCTERSGAESTLYQVNINDGSRQKIKGTNEFTNRHYSSPIITCAHYSYQGDKIIYVIDARYSERGS